MQGFYGYVADGLLSARVVLADGSAVTASATQHADLFWALKGAGHNFGVVTSFEIKAYDLPKTKWTIVNLVYTQDKLEDFVDALNDVDNEGDHDAALVLAGAIMRIPPIDPEHPVIAYQLSFLGTAAEVEPYVARFRQAGPLSVDFVENVPYKDYYIVTNNGYNQTACQIDQNISGYAVSLPNYNKTAMRRTFEIFSEFTADETFTSFWLLESYGSRGVKAVDYATSAIPNADRDLAVLTVPITWWNGSDAQTKAKADHYGKLIRSTLAEGADKTAENAHIYLNYAMGGESLQQVYGKEPLPKLMALKKKYDPANRFGFYVPIV